MPQMGLFCTRYQNDPDGTRSDFSQVLKIGPTMWSHQGKCADLIYHIGSKSPMMDPPNHAGKWMNSEDQHLLAQVDVSKCCFWSNNEGIIVRSVNFCQLSEKIKLQHENFGYFFSCFQDWEVLQKSSEHKLFCLSTIKNSYREQQVSVALLQHAGLIT